MGHSSSVPGSDSVPGLQAKHSMPMTQSSKRSYENKIQPPSASCEVPSPTPFPTSVSHSCSSNTSVPATGPLHLFSLPARLFLLIFASLSPPHLSYNVTTSASLPQGRVFFGVLLPSWGTGPFLGLTGCFLVIYSLFLGISPSQPMKG